MTQLTQNPKSNPSRFEKDANSHSTGMIEEFLHFLRHNKNGGFHPSFSSCCCWAFWSFWPEPRWEFRSSIRCSELNDRGNRRAAAKTPPTENRAMVGQGAAIMLFNTLLLFVLLNLLLFADPEHPSFNGQAILFEVPR